MAWRSDAGPRETVYLTDIALFLGLYVLLIGMLALWARLLAQRLQLVKLERAMRYFNRVMFAARTFVPAWFGIGVPKGTPAPIIDRLNREINAGLADPRVRDKLVDLGGMLMGGSPAEFGKVVVDETEKWAKVVKFSGAKPE